MFLPYEIPRLVREVEDAKTSVSLLTEALNEALDDDSQLPDDCENYDDWQDAVEHIRDLRKLVAKFEAIALDRRGNVRIY